MPAGPTIPSLNASTVNRKWVLEVNTGTSAAPVWTPVGGVKNFQPVTDDANREDDSRFSGGGYSSQTKTSAGWSATCTVARAPQTANSAAYDVGQEYLRTKAEGTFGPANTAQVRFYEYANDGGLSPRVQAYMGYASVGWSESGGAYNALSEVEISLVNTADGALGKITHPYPLVAAVPAIGSISPTTAAATGGTLLHIYGSGFTGATAVTFGGTNATNFSVENDSLIIATAPAKTAGPVNVLVTTPAGTSPAATETFA